MKKLLLIVLVLAIAYSQSEFFGRCVCKDTEEYDEATGTCKAGEVVAPTVPNCQSAKWVNGKQDPAKCERCNHKYQLENETTCKEIPSDALVDNCQYQNEPNDCNHCNDGHGFYDNGKKCAKYENGCDEFDWDQTTAVCSGCEYNYEFDSAKKTCTAIETSVANCGRWTKQDNCIRCKKGYFLKDNNCTENKEVANCKELYHYEEGCDDCDWGFTKSDDDKTCSEGQIVDCELHSTSDKTKCTFCKQGYQLNAERTTCKAIETKPDNFDENCQTFDKDMKCIGCTYSYKWVVDDSDDGDWVRYPKYGYTTSAKTCSAKCPSVGSDASILSFVLASLALLALLF